MTETSTTHKVLASKVATAVVRRLSAAGLIVDLDDGREGLIRERELAWDAEARRGWRGRYRPGDVVHVVILKDEEAVRPELSLRLARSDPWLDVEDRYPIGNLVEGVVTGIMPYGAFIELEPGVTGLIHTSRLQPGTQGTPAELFWPGDLVKVIIGKIDVAQRRVELTMADRARYRWNQTDSAGASQLVTQKSRDIPMPIARTTPLRSPFQHRAKSVLIADDNAATRCEIGDWLRNAGHHVVTAEDGLMAMATLGSDPPEVALVDIQLPQMAGTQVVQTIRRDWPEIRCILMSGEREPDVFRSELEALYADGVPLLCKPFRPEELLQYLFDVPTASQPGVTGTPITPAKSPQHTPSLDRSQIARVLDQLRRATRVSLVVLFALDPHQRKVSIVEQIGRPTIQAPALSSLIHSPVRDVAEDGLSASAVNVSEATGQRFRHLYAQLHFQSCLGLPVSAALSSRYALFLFSDQPGLAASANVEAFASASAVAAAAWLERDQFARQAAELQRLVLLGQLGRTLVHEINNQVQNIPWAAAKFPGYLEQINRHAETNPPRAQAALADANQLLQEVGIEITRLASVARPFSGLARQNRQESLLLDIMVQEAVNVVLDTAQRANVTLTTESMAPLAYTRGQGAALHQILVNVLLNAVQQIEQERGRGGGRVVVRLTRSQNDGQPVYRMSIEDDGPGIHRRLWERIFEMGYSTREGGSGVGLHVARNLIEGMSGRIFVAESWLGWGSTFVIELPR